MKVGYAYLGLAVVFILAGAYLALQERLIGDLLLLASIVLIYVGARRLADEDAAADLVARVESTDEEPIDEAPTAENDEPEPGTREPTESGK